MAGLNISASLKIAVNCTYNCASLTEMESGYGRTATNLEEQREKVIAVKYFVDKSGSKSTSAAVTGSTSFRSFNACFRFFGSRDLRAVCKCVE